MGRADLFYARGKIVTLPINQSETEERWAERVAFILQYLNDHPDTDDLDKIIQEGLKHVNRLVLGVKYRS
jgi:hypothetical protein